MSLKGSATNIRRKSAIEMTLLKCQKAEFKVINNFKSGCSLFTCFLKIFKQEHPTISIKVNSEGLLARTRGRQSHRLSGLGQSFLAIKTRALCLAWKQRYEISGSFKWISSKNAAPRNRRRKSRETLVAENDKIQDLGLPQFQKSFPVNEAHLKGLASS